MKNAARTTIVVSAVVIGIFAILFSNALGQRSFRSRAGGQNWGWSKPPPENPGGIRNL